MERSLTSSLTALNAPAKQAQMTRMSSSDEAASFVGGGVAAFVAAVGWPEGCGLPLADPRALALADPCALAGAAAGALALPEAGALALPDAGALAGAAEADAVPWAEAGALAGADADGLAWAAAGARPTCCAPTACGDGCDFFVWLPEGFGLALGLAP